jgi:hypothetical protein
MTFEQALNNLIGVIESETGVKEPITKFGVKRKAWDFLMYKMMSKEADALRITVGFHTIAEGGFRLMGIEFVAREKDNF